MNQRRSRASVWWERHQWRVGKRPRRYGPPPQRFDKVMTVSAITTETGRAMPRGSQATVIDTDPTDAPFPVAYVVQFSQWEMARVHPGQIVRR